MIHALVFFVCLIIGLLGLYLSTKIDTPYRQAEWRRKVNERFKEICGGEAEAN